MQQILNVPGRLRPIEMVQSNGNVQKEQGSRGIEIELRTLEGHSCHINEIRTVRKLDLPTQSVDARELCKKYQYLNSVNIPSYVQGSPTTLLGLPHAHLLYAMTYRVGMPGEPVAVKTPLGWTIFGGSGTGVELQTITKVVLNQEAEKSMDKIMKDYFSVEGFGVSPIAPTSVSKDEERAIQIMESTFQKIEGDSYETGLL